jgi:hypothetical protein
MDDKNKEAESAAQPHGQFLVYRAEDGRTKIDVRLEGETAWLTQAHLAELFQTTVPNISMHLRNIFEEGELQQAATVKKFLTVRREGDRDVARQVDYYNLDAI